MVRFLFIPLLTAALVAGGRLVDVELQELRIGQKMTSAFFSSNFSILTHDIGLALQSDNPSPSKPLDHQGNSCTLL
ncbi:unnamed protein product [Caenorhabditis auriculariae]|uniref:Uncharacterized protein n=1 Tax=Caenorhabditis auriculariae TaxID=2777116 RepID=A0A8S1HQ52_9PELO|nr:unnamed protein product [Caenorhabditis auriculariae]